MGINIYPDYNPNRNIKSTDSLNEGDVNLYYTLSKFDSDFETKSTDSLPEGDSNLYFKENRVLTTTLTGLLTDSSISIDSSDNVLEALGKLQAQIDSSSGGGGGSPTSSSYLVLDVDGTLTNERILTPGNGIKFKDSGAGNPLTVELDSSISTNTSLSVVGSITDVNLDDGERIKVVGDFVYIPNPNTSTLTIVDVSDPTTPTIASSTTSGNFSGIKNVYIQGSYLFAVGPVDDEISIYDISDPNSPTFVDYLQDNTNLNGVNDIYVKGRYAYVACQVGDNLTVLDISDPENMSVISTVSDTSLNGANSIYVKGNYAYVSSGAAEGISIVDITNPYSPTVVGSIEGDSINLIGANSIIVSENFAYVTAESANRFTVIDVSDPTSPVVSDSISISEPYSCAISRNFAYVNSYDTDTIFVIDISNPTDLVNVDNITDGTNLNGVFGLSISGDKLYASANLGNGLTIVDIYSVKLTSFTGGVGKVDHLEVKRQLRANEVIVDGPRLLTVQDFPRTAGYLTLSDDSSLSDERILTPGPGLSFTDNGAGNILLLNLDSVSNVLLYGLSTADSSAVDSSDNIVQSIGKLQGQLNNVGSGGGTSFSAAAFGITSPQTIANGTWTNFAISSPLDVMYDIDGYHDSSVSKDRLQVNVSDISYVQVGFRGTWEQNTSGQRFGRISHLDSTGTVKSYVGHISKNPDSTNGHARMFMISRPISVEENDYFLTQVYQNSGVSLNLYAHSESQSVSAHQYGEFWIQKLG